MSKGSGDCSDYSGDGCSDSGEGSDSGDGSSGSGDGCSDVSSTMPECEDPSNDNDPEVADTLPDPEELQTVQQWGGGDISKDSQASDPVMSSLIELLLMLLHAIWFVIWLVAEVIRGIYLMQRAQ